MNKDLEKFVMTRDMSFTSTPTIAINFVLMLSEQNSSPHSADMYLTDPIEINDNYRGGTSLNSSLFFNQPMGSAPAYRQFSKHLVLEVR
jgi:hypothetical protein